MTSSTPFQTLNLNEAPPTPTTTSFTLAPPTPSDIWRKPPALDDFNAPLIYKSLPLHTFKRVRVTITAPWRTLFDQGGLVFALPPSKQNPQRRWVKSGVEFYDGKPYVSTVAADRWADWSLVAIDGEQAEKGVTIEFERRDKDDTLWAYVLGADGKRQPLREVTWALAEFEEVGKLECWVGVYAAKPTADKEEQFVVQFRDFEVEVL
ncbi:hypothetical protein F5884DRAFT_37563 [Xylogone sp. PMI_703]|nr:hypothetical protein F5884DRAFT_37563 [Xylogone sp. PMI_703]